MNWTRITEEDLECVLNKTQLDLLKSEAVRRNNASIAAKAIELAVSRIRAEIAASGVNMLDEDYAKIPPELRECGMRLAVDILQSRIPSLELSQSQLRAIESSNEILRRVAAGELPVVRPRRGIKTARKYAVDHKASERRITRVSTEGM